MKNGYTLGLLRRFPFLERYYRLMRTYVFGKNSVKRIWSYPGDVNERFLAEPKDLKKGYFLDFSKDADYKGPFDAQGVPLIDYGGIIGLRYNPWAVGHYGLASFEKYLQTQDERYHKQFLSCARWLVEHAEYLHNGSIVWSYNFSLINPFYGRPFISALAQAHAISVLLRAFLLLGDQKLLGVAERAFVPFTLPVSQGGVQFADSEGNIFLEEDSSLLVPHILNGFIFALLGVHDFASLSNDAEAWKIWHNGLATLRKYLPSYDTGFFSLYNLSLSSTKKNLKNFASLFYHLVHIRQLQVLYILSGERIFQEYSVRWTGYLESVWCRSRAYLGKVIFKLVRY